MPQVRALTSFSGLVTAYNGQIFNIEDDYIVQDLLKAGYIELKTDNKPGSEENQGPVSTDVKSTNKKSK